MFKTTLILITLIFNIYPSAFAQFVNNGAGLTYTSDNVGIGTSTPNYKLDVNGVLHTSGQAWFTYSGGMNSSWTNAAITTTSIELFTDNTHSPTFAFNRAGSGGPQFRLAGDGSNVLYLESSGYQSARVAQPYGGNANDYFNRFHVDGAMTTSGNFGIRTSAPRSILDVAKPLGNGELGSVLARLDEGNPNGEGTFLGIRGYATQAVPGQAIENVKSFAIEHAFYGHINSSIGFFRGYNELGGSIAFSTNNNNEQMRILSNGNIGIGTIDTKGYKLAVAGNVVAESVTVKMREQ
jgi:hypothetical protein